jgi:hypothetical protein
MAEPVFMKLGMYTRGLISLWLYYYYYYLFILTGFTQWQWYYNKQQATGLKKKVYLLYILPLLSSTHL